MLKANRGEWSEIYTLFKIFDEKKVAAADEKLMPIEGQSYTFLKVLREDVINERLEYNLESPGSVVIYDADGNEKRVINTEGLGSKTRKILQAIRDSNASSFEMPFAEDMMSEYLIGKIKASSSQKSDLVAVILDRIADHKPELGFSIKSQLGGASTLLNASSQTNFIYNVKNYNGTIDEINEIVGSSKVRDRLVRLREKGATLEFQSTSSDIFNSNMRLVDSSFSTIISEMLIAYYSGKAKYVPDLCKIVGEMNILGMNEHEVSYKVKSFLRSVALGMVPSRPWNTYLSTYGGYLIVKENGDLVCYHLYNDDQFKDYLFNNTHFETASTGRHGFGRLYEENGELMFKLNLQIRFN